MKGALVLGASLLSAVMLTGCGGGGGRSHDTASVKRAFEARGIKLQVFRLSVGVGGLEMLSGGNVWVDVCLPKKTCARPLWPTRPMGGHLTRKGNVWVYFDSAQRRSVLAALRGL